MLTRCNGRGGGMRRLVSLTLLRGNVLAKRTLGGFMGHDVSLVGWTVNLRFL